MVSALEILSARRPLRLAVLLAVSAVSMPYGGLIHDSQLYAAQVLNRVRDGAFASDLFFKFGSQDQYTPFSTLAAPLARLVGVEATFFLLFVGSTGLLVVAIEQFVSAVVADPMLRTATQMFLVTSSLPYAGLRMFHLRESFLTPRTAAAALALMALAAAARDRHRVAVLCSVCATVIHPLMGAGAVIVVAIMLGASRLPPRIVYVVAGTVGVSIVLVLVDRPTAYALFGTMDAEWLTMVTWVSPYAVLKGWTGSDWGRLAAAFFVVGSAAVATFRSSRRSSMLFFAVAVTAGAGVVASAIATGFGYRFLVQAQPYRAVWLLQAIQIPAAVVVARMLWRRAGWGPPVAVGLLCVAVVADFTVFEVALPAAICVALVIAYRRAQRPVTPGVLAAVIAASAVAGWLMWGGLKLAVLLQRRHDFLQLVDVTFYARALFDCVPRPVWFGAILSVIAGWGHRGLTNRRAVAILIVLGVAPHAAMFALHESPAVRFRFDPIHRDVVFVKRFLDDHYPRSAPPPTVYAGAWGDLGRVWLGLGARNYLAAIVVIFREETARETRRRAEIVRPFELARWTATPDLVPEAARPLVQYLYAPDRQPSAPAVDDLERLCRPEERVDVVVLSQRFGDRVSAANGRVFIYECERVRAVTS